jgi:hypothetical protein
LLWDRHRRRAAAAAAALLLLSALIAIGIDGSPALAIKGGRVVVPPASSYVVELAYAAPGGWALVCTGTLIDPWWVLTASHCVSGFVTNPAALVVASGGVLVAHADGIDLQPGAARHGAAFVNDLALVHLAVPDTGPVVELARSSDAPLWDPCGLTRTFAGCGTEAPRAGQAVQAFGYGGCDGPCAASTTLVPGVLKTVAINVLTYAALRNAYATSADAPWVASAYDNMIIGAGVVGGAADTSDGDSGGPLLVQGADGGSREVAVTSWSDGTCGPVTPNGVYMQLGIGPARHWIESLVPSVRDPIPDVSSGYWMVDARGNVYPFGHAHSFGSTASGFVVHIEPTPNRLGYWTVNTAGQVFGSGNARPYGTPPALGPGEYVVSLSSTATGDGYWLFTNGGRALPYGDATFYGDMRGTALKGPIVTTVATPTGRGYYMVGSDGGIFTFGDAQFRGSTGSMVLNRPVVGIAVTPGNQGYWLIASDGGVFAFNAPFLGSMGGSHLNAPVAGGIAYGDGYLLVASDGGVFDFSDTPFAGSLGGNPPAAPVVGIAASTHA